MSSPLRQSLPPPGPSRTRRQLIPCGSARPATIASARELRARRGRFISTSSRVAFLCVVAATVASRAALAREPIPDRLVVLTFDDSVKSHFTIVRPILLKHHFRATFFITEGFNFKTDKEHYMM